MYEDRTQDNDPKTHDTRYARSPATSFMPCAHYSIAINTTN